MHIYKREAGKEGQVCKEYKLVTKTRQATLQSFLHFFFLQDCMQFNFPSVVSDYI